MDCDGTPGCDTNISCLSYHEHKGAVLSFRVSKIAIVFSKACACDMGVLGNVYSDCSVRVVDIYVIRLSWMRRDGEF